MSKSVIKLIASINSSLISIFLFIISLKCLGVIPRLSAKSTPDTL